MREFPLSQAERRSLLHAACSSFRLDGRRPHDFRNIRVYFPPGPGRCQVRLGDTLVMSVVSCELAEPRSQRPSEGIFHLNLDLSPMASAAFEGGRLDRAGASIQALLEHCIRDSRCLDLESLCIVAGEKVFVIRLDLTVLNHAGNLLDCAVLSAVAALAHFRRPDVTVTGRAVRVHPPSEREPVPLTLRHFPLTLSLALFSGGKVLLLDPSRAEEQVMDGLVVVAMNLHRELCGLQTLGGMLLERRQVLRCVTIAKRKIRGLTYALRRSLSNAAAGVCVGGDPELVFDLAASLREFDYLRHAQKREEAGLSEGELSGGSEPEEAPAEVAEEAAGDIYQSALVAWDGEPGADAATEADAARMRRKRRRQLRGLGADSAEQEVEEDEAAKLLSL